MQEIDNRNVRVRFFKKDEDNLTFLMKKTGLTQQSTAIRFALEQYRIHSDLLETLKEIKDTQKELIKQNEFLKIQINSIFE